MESQISVNLVKGRKPHFTEKFVTWALSAGRVVIILTELVALGAFLYRFGLDRQLVDLHDKISQEQNIVKFFKTKEDMYRNLQDRISLSKKIMDNENQMVKRYQDISNFIPSSMTIKNFTFASDNAHLEASIQSVPALTTFVDSVKNYPGVTGVSLDRIENTANTATTAVSITILFKPIPGAATL